MMYITTDIEPEKLALTIANGGLSHGDLIRFIIAIDEEVAEMEFTVDLRDAFSEVIKAEGGE